MAYHFRKLSQTFRILPSTKSIGFSTRVSEGDQKNSHIDGSPVNTQIEGSSGRVPCESSSDKTVLEFGLSPSGITGVHPLLRSQSNADLFNNLQPFLQVKTVSLPVVYKDIAQVLLPRVSDEEDSEDKDPIFSVVKPVGLTSDDILVHLTDTFNNSETMVSTREQIPIHVLTQNYFSRLADLQSSLDLPRLDNVVLSDISSQSSSIDQPHVYYSSDTGSSPSQKGNNSAKDGPSPEQMHEAKNKLEQLVIHLFKGHHGYEMLHQHVVLENNLFGSNKKSIGVTAYKLELLKLRLCIHIQLFSTSMEILSVTTLEQTGVIRIHWRLKGLPQTQNLKFWRLFQSRETISKDDWEWLEAFSYFHIGKDGLVHKHRIDRMMPDDSQHDLTVKLRGLFNPAKPLVN